MSMTVWLNVRKGDGHESDGEDRSAIFYLQEPINALADALGIKSLTDFFDDTDCRYNLGEDDELEECEDGWPASAARWHEAGEVLAAVNALLGHLQQHASALPEQDGFTQAMLMEELEQLIPALKTAQAAGESVHLLIVM